MTSNFRGSLDQLSFKHGMKPWNQFDTTMTVTESDSCRHSIVLESATDFVD